MRYPLTGHIDAAGFGAYLEAQLGAPRANLQRFAAALAGRFQVPHVTLVNSGSSANLAAAHALRERAPNRRAVVSAFTFPTTVSALLNAGFEVFFADTGEDDCQLAPSSVPLGVGLIALTHFLGWPAPVREVAAAHPG